MKVLFGEIIVAGSGKLGGHVQSRNRGGPYVRTRVTPLNPNTPFQIAARQTLAVFSETWRTLTQAQITAWNEAVDNFKKTDVFGEIRRPTGKNLFTRLNINLASIGIGSISDPPAPTTIAEPTITGVTIDEPGNTFDIAFSGGSGNVGFQIWATESLSPGVSFSKPFFKLFTTEDGAVASPIDVDAAYRARFGDPVVGQKIFVKLVPIENTTGQAGIGSEDSAIVT